MVTDIHACTDLSKLYNVSYTFHRSLRTGYINGYTMGPQVGLLIFKMQNTRIFTMKKLTKILKNLPQRRGRQRRRGMERQKEERKTEKR